MGKVKILLIEDSAEDIELTREAFLELCPSVELLTARDGATAMEILRAGDTPSLVLLDLNLPRMNGREVLREIKSDPQLATIPVIILTTSSANDDVLEAYRNHANCYLTKPLHFEQFLEQMRGLHRFWGELAKLPPAS
ncbi:MAG: response regulator [Vulcanimicrobiota bacterium]